MNRSGPVSEIAPGIEDWTPNRSGAVVVRATQYSSASTELLSCECENSPRRRRRCIHLSGSGPLTFGGRRVYPELRQND